MSVNVRKNQDFWNFSFTVLFLLLAASAVVFFKTQNIIPKQIAPFTFFIISLATFRLIRLFVYDSVTSYIRDYLAKFEHGPRKTLSNLISCPWCTGVWMALLIGFFYFATPFSWFPIFILALAGAGSFIQITINRIGR